MASGSTRLLLLMTLAICLTSQMALSSNERHFVLTGHQKQKIERIGDLGPAVCEGLLHKLSDAKMISEITNGEERIRRYEIGRIRFTTSAQDKEIIDGAVLPADEFSRLGLAAKRPHRLVDFLSKFGAPSQKTGEYYVYGSEDYETAAIFVYHAKGQVTKISVSCG